MWCTSLLWPTYLMQKGKHDDNIFLTYTWASHVEVNIHVHIHINFTDKSNFTKLYYTVGHSFSRVINLLSWFFRKPQNLFYQKVYLLWHSSVNLTIIYFMNLYFWKLNLQPSKKSSLLHSPQPCNCYKKYLWCDKLVQIVFSIEMYSSSCL